MWSMVRCGEGGEREYVRGCGKGGEGEHVRGCLRVW